MGGANKKKSLGLKRSWWVRGLYVAEVLVLSGGEGLPGEPESWYLAVEEVYLVGSLVSERISSSSSLERKKNRGKKRRFFSR